MADNYSVFNPTVDLNPYANQIAEIQRRQRMAQLLQQQGMEPLESQVVGGQVIRTSPWQVLAKALQTGMGSYQGSQANKAAAELQDQISSEQRQRQAEIESAGAGIAGRLTGEKPQQYDAQGMPINPRPTEEPTAAPQMPDGALEEITPTGKYTYDPAAAFRMAMTPTGAEAMKGNPALASLLAQTMKPKEPEKFGTTPVLGEDGNYYLVSESGRMVRTNVPGKIKTESAPASIQEYNFAQNQGYKGTYTQWLNEKARSGATNVSIPINTSKTYGQEVASSLAKADSDAIAAARAAPEQIASSQRIRNLLAQNPITGTGANARLALDKALSTAGLIDPTRSITTENLISELANGTLGAVKSSGLGAGQGFTDNDLKFLQMAKSGNIEINSATLARIADLNERAARASGTKGNAVINRLSKSGNFGPELGLEPVELPPISGGLPSGFVPDKRRQ